MTGKMNAATNVKQIQGSHTPITPFIGFIALMAIALVGCAIISSAVMSLTGASFAVAQCPAFNLAGFGAAVAPLLVEFVVLFAIAAGLTYLVSRK